ncbi:MAG: glutathione S-transferase family protein [Pseudomonadota bacterium]
MQEELEPVAVYGDMRSGNCWKVRWTVEMTGRSYSWHETDIMAGASRTEEFLAMNPAGKVPMLRLADGRCLSESNAICWYLAEGSNLLPDDRFLRAEVMQWQCFEQYSHEPYIAVARFIRHIMAWPNERAEEYEQKLLGSHAALAVLESRLSGRDWLVGETLSIADISLFAYTHVAHEAHISLQDYDAVRAWIDRCQGSLPDIGIGE